MRVCVVASCATLALRALAAQPAVQPLRAADARVEAVEFSQVAAVRELRDGRVIVLDDREQRLLVVRPGASDTTRIGRRGNGPGEYRQLGRLIALTGDSTIAVDPAASRWLVLDGAEVVATVTSSDPLPRTFRMGSLEGAGRSDELVGLVWARPAPGQAMRMPDSLTVVRINRATRAVDSVVRASTGLTERSIAQAAPAGPVSASPATKYVVPLAASDQVASFPDGWFAVARVAPYRVDWCAPGGRCATGPTLERPGPVSSASQRAILRAFAAVGETIGSRQIAQTVGWPDMLPPFVRPSGPMFAGAVLPLPGGELLVERLAADTLPRRRYDVIDRRGMIVRRVSTPLNARIVGVGVKSVYTADADADGIQRLARHPWP
jgi:hypothetical protein